MSQKLEPLAGTHAALTFRYVAGDGYRRSTGLRYESKDFPSWVIVRDAVNDMGKLDRLAPRTKVLVRFHNLKSERQLKVGPAGNNSTKEVPITNNQLLATEYNCAP